MEGNLKRNLSYQTIYQALTVITPLIVTPYISRVLGSTNIGVYSYTYSIAYYFVMFAMLGVTNYGNRTIASVNNSKEIRSRTFWEIYCFQALMAIFMTLIYAIYVLFICNHEKTVSMLQIIYVLTALFDISWLYFGIEDVKPVVIKNTIIKLISLIGIFTLIRSENDLWLYTILLSGGQLLGCMSMWLTIKKKVIFIKPSWNGIIKHIKPNLVLFIPVIAISIYKTMDKIMLGAFCNDSQVGFYTNAENLINAPLGFIIAVGNVMLPRITNLLATGKTEKSIYYFRQSLKLTMCFGSAAAFGIMTVAPNFVPIYYGPGYDDCVFLLCGQAVVLLILSWANVVRTQFLLPHKHDKQYIISIFSGAVINVLLNMLLIPRYQAGGALIATIFAEALVCIIQSYDAAKYINMFSCLRENLFFFTDGLVMLMGVHACFRFVEIKNKLVYLGLQIVVGAVIYLLLLAIYLLLNRKVLKRKALKNTLEV